MTAELDIYLHGDLAGRLWLDGKRWFTFRYDRKWLAKTGAIPLSLSLPLREEPFEDDASRPFFANLLPEAEIRRIIARRLGISEQNDFALLEAIGGECAGAVLVLPAGTAVSFKGEYRPLSEEALHEIVVSLPVKPFLAGEEGLRLSLAGAQNKLPVYEDNGRICLPMGVYPSSHIIKPPISDLRGTVENEAFCMTLALRMGLPVPRASVRRGVDTLYIVERYDRVRDERGNLTRLHQEDFCQALGVPPDQKYESEGGPSLAQCFRLLRERSIRPASDQRALAGWVIFNYLIGNADAHAKNIAILLTDEGPLLAPFYDLLSTAIYKDLASKMAMKVGGENRPDWIHSRHWERFADEVSIKPRLVTEMLKTMASRIVEDAEEVVAGFNATHGAIDVTDSILGVIRERCRKALLALSTG